MAWKILTAFAAIFLAVAGVFRYLNYVDGKTEEMLVERAEKNLKNMKERSAAIIKEDEDTDLAIAMAQTAKEHYDVEEDKLSNAVTGKIKGVNDEIAVVQGNLSALETKLADLAATEARIGPLEQVVEEMKNLSEISQELESEIEITKIKIQETVAETEENVAIINELRQLESDQALRIMKPSFRGRITEVHGSWGFVVINAGNNEQVYTRAKLDVMRGGEEIGQLNVSFVSPTQAICDILPNTFEDGLNPRVGDEVKPSKREEKPETPAPDPAALPENPGPATPVVPPAGDPNDPFSNPGTTPTPNPFGGTPSTPSTPSAPTPNPFGATPSAPSTPSTPTPDPFSSF